MNLSAGKELGIQEASDTPAPAGRLASEASGVRRPHHSATDSIALFLDCISVRASRRDCS